MQNYIQMNDFNAIRKLSNIFKLKNQLHFDIADYLYKF